MALYKIDAVQYGLTEGSFGQAPYTAQEYTQAYNNGVGLQNAINYAHANGYEGVILPKGVYSLTYKWDANTNVYNNGIIIPKSNQTIDLNGSTLEVIFDSVNKSPYHTISESAWQLHGNVFLLIEVHNVKICNGEIKGDIYNRAFSNSSEVGMEQTYGVRVSRNVYNFKLECLNIHGFMGDGITMSTRSFRSPAVSPSISGTPLIPGYINTDGSISTVDGAYMSSNFITVDRALLKTLTPLTPNTIQIQTSGGYNRVPRLENPNIHVAFYTSTDVFIYKKIHRYLDKIVLPPTCTKIKIGVTNEAVGLPSITHPSIQFTEIASGFGVVNNCIIHDNHRGGISNAADDTVIENNEIFHNGMDSSVGAPVFNNITRYQINCEDSVSRNVVIRNNNIYSGFSGVLMGVYTGTVEGNTLNNTGGVIVYSPHYLNITGNRIYNADSTIGLFPPLSFASASENRTIIFSKNKVRTNGYFIDAGNAGYAIKKGDKIIISDNDILASGMKIRDDAFYFTGNIFSSQYITASTFEIMAKVFEKNIFKNLDGTKLNLSISTKSGGNEFYNCIISRTFSTDSTQEFNKDIFVNCEIKNSLSTTVNNVSLIFKDCTFTDTYIEQPSGYVSNSANMKINTFFDRCYINLGTVNFLRSTSYSYSGIVLNVNIADSKIIFANGATAKLFHTLNGRRAQLTVSNLRVENDLGLLNYLR